MFAKGTRVDLEEKLVSFIQKQLLNIVLHILLCHLCVA